LKENFERKLLAQGFELGTVQAHIEGQRSRLLSHEEPLSEKMFEFQ
jgi:hypothetical protein